MGYHRGPQKKLTGKRYSKYFTKTKPMVKLDEVYASNGEAVVSSFDLALGINLKHATLMGFIESLDLGKNTQRSQYFKPVLYSTPGSNPFKAFYITKRGFDVLGEEVFVNSDQKMAYVAAFDIVNENIRRCKHDALRRIKKQQHVKEESVGEVQTN